MLRARLLASLTAALALAGVTAGCTAGVVTGEGAPAARTSAPSTSGTGASTSAPAVGGAARFGACPSGLDTSNVPSRFTVSCATISVPLDYSNPGGRQISLALVRLHDQSDATPAGSMLIDPGGPGGSGLQFALDLSASLPTEVTAKYDVLGFDPRGVGDSTPIRCESDAEKDADNAASPDVLTAAGFAQAKQMAAEVAKECSAKYGTALAQFDTVSTARDMDRIRQAVGDAKLTYLGFSYGTELGAQYAHLFPSKVATMVLDGAVDPLTDDVTSFADQLDGFEKAFDQFASWCSTNESCSPLGNPRAVVNQLVARAETSPIPSSQPGETRKATPSMIDLGVLSALYSQQFWPVLAQALTAAESGDSRGILQLADVYNERTNGHYTNLADANTTISCNDAKPGPSDATIRKTAAAWAKRYPMFGLWSAASLFSCQQWQPHRTVPPLPTAPTTPRKVLVIGNLHDPATPYQGAKDLTRTLGNAQLLSWDGEGHTSYLQGSDCVDGYVNAYLVNGTLPPVGKTCPP